MARIRVSVAAGKLPGSEAVDGEGLSTSMHGPPERDKSLDTGCLDSQSPVLSPSAGAQNRRSGFVGASASSKVMSAGASTCYEREMMRLRSSKPGLYGFDGLLFLRTTGASFVEPDCWDERMRT
jgi:hypothetical protein